MASPAVSTPSSAGSPSNIAPAPPLTQSTTNAAASMTSHGGIAVSRQWVVPPRPKPGRKPATDTPPTKRKAQNRAAQRAFRERRAARVGELEEQLKETEEERQKREIEMHEQISEQESTIMRLLEDVQRLDGEKVSLKDRCVELQKNYEDERQEKEAALLELAYLRNGSRSTGTNAVPLPPRRHQHSLIARPLNPEPIGVAGLEVDTIVCNNCSATGGCACVEAAISLATSGCGKCTPDSHCECLEETLNNSGLDTSAQPDLKRTNSASHDSTGLKRPRFSIEQPNFTEIDFTAQFSTIKQLPMQERSFEDHTGLSRPAGESCGFCAEGTYCVCAEAAAASNSTLERDQENRLAPILSEVTPPPSENDVTSSETSAYKLPSLYPNHRMHHALRPTESASILPQLIPSSAVAKVGSQSTGSCANGPGSCKQCQEDPKSGLFCRSLAAIRASNSTNDELPISCCGGTSSGGGCCKDKDKFSPSLSCADTYKTLSSHKNFDEASDELGKWLPKLHSSSGRYPGRAPLDIEAASVMNVIKYFDVRFGRN